MMKNQNMIRGINTEVLTLQDGISKNNLLLKGYPVNRAERRKAARLEKKERRQRKGV